MRLTYLYSLAAALAIGWPLGFAPRAVAQDALVDEEGVETLTRGPLHEAFAEPVTFEVEKTLIIETEPPAPVEELPPEYKPDDEDAVWIPGYWAWDEEREDFLWISGVWRVPPPGQRWIPGYWQAVTDGYEWVPGFWVSAETEELVYQDPPPESLEAGPTSPAPSEEHFYVPGNWQYTTVGYRWQPGYWHEGYENWMWVPARWCWTPRGVVFVNGYWDYRLPQRGFVFAPVYFTRTVYTQPRFTYRPSIVLNVGVVFNNLFVRPGYRHYYFGDWYGDRYERYNILPAYAWHTRRGGYDPVISYYSSVYRRRGEDFIALSRERYRMYDRNPDRRPARTWSELERRVDRVEDRQDRMAARLRDVIRDNRNDVQFVKLEDRQVEQIRERTRELRDLTKQRNQLERLVDRQDRGERRDRTADRGDAARLTLPKVADTRSERTGNDTPRRNRPGRDDVPRPIARSERPEGDRTDPAADRGTRPDRAGRTDRGERGERPDVATTPMPTDPTDRDTARDTGRLPNRDRSDIGRRPGVAEQPNVAEGSNPADPATRPTRDRADRPGTGRDTARDPGDRLTRPGERDRTDRADGAERPEVTTRPSRERPLSDRLDSDRTRSDRLGAERPSTSDRPGADRPNFDRGSDRTGRPDLTAPRRSTGTERDAADVLRDRLRSQQRPDAADRTSTERPGSDRGTRDRSSPAITRDPRSGRDTATPRTERPSIDRDPRGATRSATPGADATQRRNVLRPELPDLNRNPARVQPERGGATRPEATPRPRVERAPTPDRRMESRQPRAERPQPQAQRPQPQPRAERPQPQVQRPQQQPQPRAERPQPERRQPAANPGGGGERGRGGDKSRDKKKG